MFEPLHHLLPKSLRRYDVYEGMQAALVLRRVETYYANILPNIQIKGLMVKRRKVFVSVPSNLLANECHLHCEGCLAALHMEGFEVDGVQFRVGRASL